MQMAPARRARFWLKTRSSEPTPGGVRPHPTHASLMGERPARRSPRHRARRGILRCIFLTLGGIVTASADLGAPIVGFTSEGDGLIAVVTKQDGNKGPSLGYSLATCDFNGDGFADLAIGVPNEDVGAAVDAGAVRVVYGSPQGLAVANNQLWDQNAGVDGTAATGNHFGATLATGDFNGDGFCDLGIGIPDEDLGTIVAAGAVQVLYGSPSGLRAANNQIWDQNKQGVEGFAAAGDRFGAALAAGDFDHDGFADLAIGVPRHDVGNAADAGAVNVLYGGPTGLSDAGNQLWSQRSVSVQGLAERGDHFGAALAAGDFDHDASADLGAPIVGFTSEGDGLIAVVTKQDGNKGPSLGYSLATCDFNGDGFADLAIGVPNEDVGAAVDAGAVRVVYGSPQGLAVANNQLWDQNAGVDGTAATGNHFGATLATGDFNGDGFCDLGIGIPDEDLGTIVAAGAVQVLYGSPSGLRAANNQIWDQNKQGVEGFAAAGDRFGAALAAGDFDHDGFADLAIGVPGHDVGNAADAGAVNVLYGGPTGLSDAGNQLWSQRSVSVQGLAERGDHFGAALAAGDFDHDGFADLAIGVPDEDLGSIVDAGAVNVLFGGPRGISALRNQFWNQSRNLQGAAERGDHFGAALAAGDFNSDGFVDLAVGVPREDVGPVVDAGAVNVLYGTRHGLTFTGTQFWNQNRPGVLDFSDARSRRGTSTATGFRIWRSAYRATTSATSWTRARSTSSMAGRTVCPRRTTNSGRWTHPAWRAPPRQVTPSARR
ncbi:MAG: hypothetical protein E6J79_04005 [Deltaproteobacteria bacterium]|nr:MAG: hypothetical protein E6J79_04005 [Deltaproteobacteria bacterium]